MSKYVRYKGHLYRAVDSLVGEKYLVDEVRETQYNIENYVREVRKGLEDQKSHLEYLINLFTKGGSRFENVKGAEKALLESCKKSYKKVNAALAAIKSI